MRITSSTTENANIHSSPSFMHFGVVGAGPSGAVIARELAEAGFLVDVFDGRNHVAGNCYTERDPESGVMVHTYGPHLFHTSRRGVWEYLQRFGTWHPYQHRVKATTDSGVYSMPINLLTLNQFLGERFRPREAEKAVAALSKRFAESPTNFEDQALSMVGSAIYNEFFRSYTTKQWGRSPRDLPASILKRLPLRFDYNDRYFNDVYEAAPVEGFGEVFRRILEHPNIRLVLGEEVGANQLEGYQHVFWTGSIDAYFDRCFGPLAYRTLDFEVERHKSTVLGTSVMNFCSASVPYTRISEHRYFAPLEAATGSVTFTETSREWKSGDVPYYPVRLTDDEALLGDYVRKARSTRGVSFVGRLGTYRYLDMDATIEEALQAARFSLSALERREDIPAFFTPPR